MTTTTQSLEHGLSVGLEFPSHVVLGQPTSLRCTFTRKPGQELDSIKWFKGDHRDHEFLRLTRWSTPIRGEFSRKEFPTKGVNIDQNLTRLELGEEGGNHTLVLPHTELSATGTYWCEITEGQVPFRTVWQERNLTIVDLKVGDKMKVRDSVATPRHGWGFVGRSSVGTLRVLPPSGYETLVIDFPDHEAWSGLLSEVEVVPDDPSPPPPFHPSPSPPFQPPPSPPPPPSDEPDGVSDDQ